MSLVSFYTFSKHKKTNFLISSGDTEIETTVIERVKDIRIMTQVEKWSLLYHT